VLKLSNLELSGIAYKIPGNVHENLLAGKTVLLTLVLRLDQYLGGLTKTFVLIPAKYKYMTVVQ